MKKLLIKIITFFKKEHVAKYAVQAGLFFLVLIVFGILATNDLTSNVFGTVVGFLFSTLLLYVIKMIVSHFEDLLKINRDTEELLQKYPDGDYRKTVEFNGTKADVAYAVTLVNDGYRFKVVDDKEKMFELDDFILNNYDRLFSAHSNSTKVNGETIRLDRCEITGGLCTFYLSRSNYFNHLLTNRAIDFNIFDDVSLRDVFEYHTTISSYEDSKMSNHIGINGLVFLSDGNILVPRRKADSTISKNKITSSIAVKLNYPKSGGDTIDEKHLLYGNIIDNLSARTKIPPKELHLQNIDVKFLGFGQSLYEGGKPQFYYVVHLNDIDTKKYLEIAVEEDDGKIDVDKCIYVADYSSYRFEKDKLAFDAIDENGKRTKKKYGYELSYLCNLWHYEEDKKRQKKGRKPEKTA